MSFISFLFGALVGYAVCYLFGEFLTGLVATLLKAKKADDKDKPNA